MSRLPRYAIIFVLSFGCAGLQSAVNSQTKAPKKVAGATVSGRVTTHGKGAPGIVVSIRRQEFGGQPAPSYKAATDQEGFYRITDVPPGNYQVSPLAPAFVSEDRSSLRDRGKALLLAEGENVDGIDFSIERGGVITGRVTDAEGRPVVEERLVLMPADMVVQPGQRFAVVPISFQTDDRGVYRIYGIPEGRYKLSVGQGDENNYSFAPPGRISYKRTYYPEADNPNDARVIEVTEGGEVLDIDIRVGRSLPGFAVSGTVVDGQTGRPVAGLRFGVRRAIAGGFATLNSTAPSNSQGEFRIENVTPGKYAVQVLSLPGSEVRAEPVPFEIVDHDVSGIVVKTALGLSISGVVVIDGQPDPSVLAKLTDLRLRSFTRRENAPGAFGDSPINADGSFRLGGLGPGMTFISLSSRDNQPLVNFGILRLERNGVVQPQGVELKPGEQVTGVRVVLRYGTGSIRGEVKFENGPLPPGARVSVWITKSDDATRGGSPRSGLDSRGRFLIEGVAAGTYELNANAYLPQSHNKPQPSVKQTVTVTEGAVTDVAVTLDLMPRQEPPVP